MNTRFLSLPIHTARPIALVGMMGTGKTTLGQMIARKLDRPFIDVDAEIERAAACPIREIFSTEGEAYFRDCEEKILETILREHDRAIVATGGGILGRPGSLSRLKDKTLMIWLKSSAGEIYKRLKNDTTRPLLQQSSPLAVLSELLEARKPLYAQAHMHVDLDDGNPLNTLDEILNRLMPSA